MSRRIGVARRCRALGVLACIAVTGLSPAVSGADDARTELVADTYGRGHGSIKLGYQAIDIDYFRVGGETYAIGDVDIKSASLEFEYAFSDRWMIELGVPYIRKRYQGGGRLGEHPGVLNPPYNQAPWLDNGEWHGGYQDWLVGVRYLLDTRPVRIEPFIHATIPSGHYSHFGVSSIGQDIWHLELGFEVTHIMPFSDWYYRVDAAYVIVEQTLGRNTNYFVGSGEVGYFLRPNLNVHALVRLRDGRGSDGPYPDQSGALWYYHGRFGHHGTGNVGIGSDWLVVESWQLSGSVFKTFWGRTVHLVDWGLTLAVTRHF